LAHFAAYKAVDDPVPGVGHRALSL